MYTEKRLEREILEGLAKIEKEFSKIEKMIATVYTLTGQHRNGHFLIVPRAEAAQMLGVSLRQMDRLANKYAFDKVPLSKFSTGVTKAVGYRKSQILEIIAGRDSVEALSELRRQVLRRKGMLKDKR
ncbi:MAG: hypothetical protein ACTTK1_05455 [Candidatus Cryptobacteroides sp.]